MLKFVGIAPHPPVIIPEVGRDRVMAAQKTVDGLQELCRRVREQAPRLVVLITPHGPVLRKGLAVLEGECLYGDFGQFGAPQVKLTLPVDRELLRLLELETAGEVARPVTIDPLDRRYAFQQLDHGTMVPLYYLDQAKVKIPGIQLTASFDSFDQLYRFGSSLRRSLEKRGEPAAVIASGDLSHRLSPGAPGGYSPRGATFDRLLIDLLREGKVEQILALDRQLVEEAGECGLRPVIIALGLFEGENLRTEIISYEGPFGVGYLVAELSARKKPATAFPESVADFCPSGLPGPVQPVLLARQSLRYFLEHGRMMSPPQPLPPGMEKPAGVFVSLKKGGRLRGCIGTVEPVRQNLAEEIIFNAVDAAVRDPRFEQVSLEEVDELSISVDLLTPPEPVSSLQELDHRVYGVLVGSGSRRGLLLPDLEGIDSVEEQVMIARRKAGIAPHEKIDLYRFRVERYI